MQLKNFFVVTVLVVLSGAWSAVAYEHHPPEFPVGGGPPEAPMGGGPHDMMQVVLDLTDKQSAAVQEIVARNQQAMADIFKTSGLNHGDMRLLQGISEKFRQLYFDAFATVFDEKQLQLLREKVAETGQLDCFLLSEKEQLRLMQDLLEMRKEQVSQVTGIIAERSANHEIVLDKLGFNVEKITALQGAMAARREEMIKSLSAVLSVEQLAKFEKLHMKMAPKEPCNGPKPMKRGDVR